MVISATCAADRPVYCVNRLTNRFFRYVQSIQGVLLSWDWTLKTLPDFEIWTTIGGMSLRLHIMLVALVVICPLWCTLAQGGCTEVVSQASPSCCCDKPIPVDSDEPQPAQSNSTSRCLCNGAIVTDSFELQLSDAWLPLLVVTELQTNTGIATSSRIVENDSVFELSGRMLRHLYMSLTL